MAAFNRLRRQPGRAVEGFSPPIRASPEKAAAVPEIVLRNLSGRLPRPPLVRHEHASSRLSFP